MRERTLIFYWQDGEDAEGIAAARRNGENHVYVRDTREYRFREEPELCEIVAFTDGVPAEVRDRVREHYQSFVDRAEQERERREKRQEWAPATPPMPQFVQAETRLTFKHRTQGRWYVMRGSTQVSGPHTKEEAQRLATKGMSNGEL